jgi:hypothetical protein
MLVLLLLPFCFFNMFYHLSIHCLSLHNDQAFFWSHNMIMWIIN